jgi:uncharacterized alkaline shock family protein YloU
VSDEYVVHAAGGSISVTPAALAAIVRRAAESVDGVRIRRRRGLEVGVEDATAKVELVLAAEYGLVLPELAREVQERVAGALASMCALSASVDVTIEELDGR